LDKKAAYTTHLLKKDPSINVPYRRLLIDITGARASAGLDRSIPINDGLLKKARAGQYNKNTVRVVLDIESIEDYKVFPLSDPFRIVIDVTGTKAPEREANEPPTDNNRETLARPSLSQQLGLKVRKIVIDPGHGGKDPGAIGRGGLKEKDVTLKLSKKLRDKLRPSVQKVVMTRETDVFIPLEERTAIANSQDADLFVSIHINASQRRAASGVETYTLNISNDEEARRLAARENATSRRSVSDLEFILNDLIKTAKTNDSVRLATSVQARVATNLKRKFNTRSNGVKGAPFYVLVGTKMPSILVEVSYISNPQEEKLLRDDRYLDEVIEGISKGLMEYINGTGSV
ncbi:MAG TPA: N-acetylmuramoyl-L-alanine amidase, partial [Thermodesulfobacteriota bacterium]|nr:N-acetylmuramoyl-L-alanine amidase [Thermodesulfobacteriota bacterium]